VLPAETRTANAGDQKWYDEMYRRFKAAYVFSTASVAYAVETCTRRTCDARHARAHRAPFTAAKPPLTHQTPPVCRTADVKLLYSESERRAFAAKALGGGVQLSR
jgi:hypothetical protein